MTSDELKADYKDPEVRRILDWVPGHELVYLDRNTPLATCSCGARMDRSDPLNLWVQHEREVTS